MPGAEPRRAGGSRPAHSAACAQHRVTQRQALRQARGNGRWPGAAGAVGVARCNARRGRNPRRHLVASRSTTCSPGRVAALQQHGGGAPSANSAGAARACIRRRSRITCRSSASASGTFGVISAASGSSRRSKVPPPRQRPAGVRRPSPPSPDRPPVERRQRRRANVSSATASIVAASPSMPVLTTSAPISAITTSICWRDEVRRHRMHAIDAERVLRGQRGDRGGGIPTNAR